MPLKLMSVIATSSSPNETSSNEGADLLKQLLECVKECQKRYGGKTELATEFDSCVAGLCLSLEAIFLHGLKPKPLNAENASSALKQVSGIVAQSLHIANESPSFWPFVNKHLTKHEQERFEALKQIWTDSGRGKAWIRSALNEKSLERYFHTVLSNQEILKEHYETWAILRDDEKNSMLPNMAAGLASILFAISIDKPELNSGIARRPAALKAKAEPIIEAPIPDKKESVKPKKKRKVARQLISFDDDDSAISTSVPSSSSSTTSDSFSLEYTKSIKAKPKRMSRKKMEQPTETPSVEIRERKLSIENSGSREKYYSNVESLTPVTQEEIGELRPVSVEINENFSATGDRADDAVEVPSDISAVLTAVEEKNKEELERKEEKIQLLSKENEGLKEQVKKYMSAIQMLRRDDEGLNKALEGLQIEGQPDYKSEARFFEQKLIQVADMHAELMDFNVMLQQTIFQKDQMIEKLKKELEILRGPVPEMRIGESSSVHVWIPSAFLTGSGSNSHHVYQIYLKVGNDEWNIYRRYAQFHALHTDLKKLDPAVAAFDFPPKKSIGKKDSALVEDRRKRLQVYLRRVLSHWPELKHCNNRFLLEQHLAFFKDQREDQRVKSTFPPTVTTSNSSGL
ncbi:unnamed protein product [Acanthoscelides obtectus]|uniref:Sorting nexin-29 n=2 Tax=Acanthoscelides obtectus TaxID=200917 RepID=A0A9P0LUT5_ACAOB|nr:unnamed protein product [Acanthoscelides obtectus]CAK1620378.1 Sorting nexin-29 [Acanthoscelides obtectus]